MPKPEKRSSENRSSEKISVEQVYPLIREVAGLKNQRAAVKAMKQIHALGADALEPLVQATQDPNVSIRTFGFSLLKDVGDSRAVAPLAAGLTDRFELIVGMAIAGLQTLKDPAALEPLAQFIERAEARVEETESAALDIRVILDKHNLQAALAAVAVIEDNNSK